ncbi:class I SAM-dependent methyltransferase [Lacibacter luteus]|uniref:Class I SAM-dependent methyltransferase n=1 Tax=Lacibacter luteus TaxID=2508719 RepID=A0A4V1M829_9BACT|nr:class I SAM-dependent methyltransferase [Lacibacter luteus]RXK62412.1 class I SAM-dependent methyltransferase [Lacibacter luteus]
MYSAFKIGKKFLHYYFTAANGKGHGVHSPFVFDLITKVLNDTTNHPAYTEVEEQRRLLLQNETVLTVEDFGAGSTKGLTKQRVVKQIAATSLKPKKYAQLLFRLVNYFQPKQILELGTSLGITTAYLAKANTNAVVTTMEGSAAIAAVAQEQFDALQLKNVNADTGNFDETLPELISKPESAFDFVFIDGNHRKEPTLRYFEQLLAKAINDTVFVFDDIHWSAEMEEAWEELKQHPQVTLTIDLFFIGLVFLRKEQKEREHFVIRF